MAKKNVVDAEAAVEELKNKKFGLSIQNIIALVTVLSTAPKVKSYDKDVANLNNEIKNLKREIKKLEKLLKDPLSDLR